MKNLDTDILKQTDSNLGGLKSFKTLDGTTSLHSEHFKEKFHSQTGAKKEAIDKFIKPAELHRFKNKEKITVLDVCVGMGYNTACLLERLTTTNLSMEWWGLEVDPRPLQFAIDSFSQQSSWDENILNILKALIISGQWKSGSSHGTLIWGDARDTLKRIPNNTSFDLIFLDAFSPKKCPELWTREFITILVNKLNPNGRLITYCCAAGVRNVLKESGLEVMSLLPTQGENNLWSLGTVGIQHENQKRNKHSNIGKFLRPLNQREEEHLLTRAGIPYRDPSGISTGSEIMERREQEQNSSNYITTSSWKRKWKDAKSDREN